MNFDLLRSEGIRHISSLSGDLWTDHNLHDPGITILEVLCYALTDLGYRNSLPVEDLLAKDPDSPTRFLPDDNFFTAAELLTCNPLTILDYRKMLMNIGGVRNAWLELATGEEVLLKTYPEGTPECEKVRLKGLYKVILELDAFAEGKTLMEQEGKVDGILRQATALLHQHRNLCEDFLDIFVLGDEEIGILADLEISPDASPDDVMVEAMVALQEFLSPKVPYYTLKEMIAKGKSMEEIFRGRAFDATEPPSLNGLAQQENFGFIDTEELEQIERKTELHASDFYRIIMDVKGVNAVRSLKLFNFMGGLKQTSGEDWCLRLTARHRAVMSPWLSEVHCFKNGLKFSPDKIKVTKRFKDRISGLVAKTLKPAADLDAALPQGNFRKDLGEYYSIQHEFPLLYRIGIDELPDSAPAELHAKKQQLKGYLLFFDQLLANYLAQLAHLRNLFVLRPHRNEHPDGSLKTIFSQKLDSVPELDTLLRYANQEAALSKTGEVLLEPLPGYLQFSTQEQRELAIRRFISEFEAGGMKVSHRETAKGTFQYVLESLGEVVMASSREYPSANAALAAGEALHFLGAIRDCYALGAPEKTGKFSYTYSFKLVLNPLPYEAYLSQISEKPDQAEGRRTRFLNHLLARFAEEFTDYTLLMYGLEGKKRNEEQIIKDKEIFLSDYPRISRDRGRGFNYQQPKAGNVSGLERRVESLMGITNRERNGGNSLSNIELAAWEPLHFPEIRNTRGDVVFRGVNGFPTAEEAKPEALKIMALAKELKCYSLQHCASKNVFSFQLEDENGNLIARHPLNYESKKKAEKKRSCLLKMAATKGNCFVKVIENKASGYFTLFDGKKKHPGVLFESTKACADVAEARERWLDFVKALDHPAPFVKVENEQGGNFSFIVANEQGEPIARHPKWYCTSKGRTAAMQKWEAYLREKKLRPRIETKPVFYRWQLVETSKRLPLLESLPRFESEAQAVANYEWFVNVAIERSNWDVRHEEESGRYAFVIQEKGGYEAAHSPWHPSKKKCDEALVKAQKLLAKVVGLEVDFRTKRSKYLRVVQFPERYTFILAGENGAAAMVGGQLYDSIEAAEWAFYQFTEKAAKPKNYVLEREEGSCRFTFAIPTPYCGHEATHPVWYPNKALAKKAMYDLAAFVEANRLHFKVDFAPVSWRPELHWENTEGACVPVLIGENRRKKGEAEDEAGNWADIISEKAEALRATCKKGCFSFRLRPEKEGAILARHPVFYSSAAGRDKMLKSARGLRIESSGWRHTTVVEWTKPSTEQGNFGFRMVKSGGSLASHPQTYSKAKKRDAIFDELIVLGKAGALVVSEISATEKSAFFLGKNKWTFVIRGKRTDRSFCPGSNEDKGGGKVWWQSVKGFYSETEAKKAFDKDFLDILRLASNAANYKICSLANCKWEVVLLGDDTSAVAKIPELFTSEKAARRAVEERVVNAKTYPFFRECDQWRFRILSIGAEEDTVLWESGGNFSTIADAAKELYRFLHAATYPGNYFRKDNASAGRFGIEMREVQLESSFKSATRENAWLQADEFSLLADEEGAFYPFVAPDDVCRYGLRVVRQNYVLARHIRRYHSADLQEAALHGLHAEARNRLVGASRLSTGFCRKGEEIYLNITDNDAGAVIWRSASGFPPGAVNAAEHATRHYLGSTDQPEAYRNFYLTLYEYARHADFYQIMQEAGQKFRLALFNPDGRIELLTTKTFPTKEECEAEANRLIRLFRRYPVLKEEEQYYFQYYSFDEAWALSEEEPQSGIFDTGKIIWESSLAYASATEASEAFERFTILLADKSNYQRISEKGNRYFSIELTDPEAILAVHPLTYCTKEEVQNLAGDIRATLDGEGLHLLEHILFRPKNKGAFTGNYLIKTCAKEQPDIHFSSPVLEVNRCGKMVEKLAESCFRPYADPYSFWMTVVLPYWPKRFQNLDFRKFFENTLRRETPAHIALKIVWVGPEQMHLFETKYHAWLAALGLEGDCLRGSAQDDFMEFLFEEIQQGNPPILLDTTDKSQQIILDESRLTL